MPMTEITIALHKGPRGSKYIYGHKDTEIG